MGERNHFTGQQITRSDRSSHKNRSKLWSSCREKSFSFYYSHSGAADAVAEKPSSMNDNSFLKNRHSLAKKTVVQLRPKSTTGKKFLFRVSVWVNCLCPFMLNISLILLHKWFRWCRYQYFVDILVIPYASYGSCWLTYISCSHYKCLVTQNA